MSEKYNTEDFYFATIDVFKLDFSTSHIAMGTGYSYKTVLKKDGNHFDDLKHDNRVIHDRLNNIYETYSIVNRESLCEHTKRKRLSKRKALNIGKKIEKGMNR